MRAGDYNGALPLLQQAVQKLRGVGYPNEAYANYNLGYTLLQLGNCSESLPYFDQSEAIQGHRDEIDQARRDARKCVKKGS